ncbi:MAG: peptidylprolyl isomerase [Christensenellales bacterium]
MKHKRITALLLAVLSILVFSGCHMVTLNSERDMAQVVATVNGKAITKGDVYETVAAQYGDYYYQYASMSEKGKQMIYEWALEDMILYEVKLHKALELGMDKLSDEKKAEVEKEIDDSLQEMRDSIVVPEGEQDKDAYIEEQIETRMEAAGMPLEEYKTTLYDAAAISALEESIKNAAVQPTEDDIKLLYENLLAYQQYVYEQPFSKDETSQAVQEMFKGTQLEAETLATTVYKEDGIVIYHPSVEHRQGIYIKMEYSAEIQNKINEIKEDKQMTDAEKETAIAALRAQGQSELAQDMTAVQTALASDKSKEKFEALIEEYSDDLSQSSYLPYGGYVMHADEEAREEALRKALFGLTAQGEISGPAYSDTGCYIVMLVKVFTPGTIKTLEEVHDKLVAYKTTSIKQTEWDNQVTKWKEESDVKQYKDRLFN